MKSQISVIIPTLNEQKNIQGCLDCLYSQTKPPLEIIIIDNLSTDKTIQITKTNIPRFKNKNISLKILSCQKGNQTNARNMGTKKAIGKIVGSLDADAFPAKNWTEEIEKAFKNKKIVGVGGKSHFRNKGKIFNSLYLLRYHVSIVGKFYCIGGGNSAFVKKVFLQVNGFEGLEKLRIEKNIKYAKDDFYLTKKLETIGKIKYCPKINVTLLSRVRKNHNRQYKKNLGVLDVLKRSFLDAKYDYIITQHFKKK